MSNIVERRRSTDPVPYSALVAFSVFSVLVGMFIGWSGREWLVEKAHQMEDGREVSRHDMSTVR